MSESKKAKKVEKNKEETEQPLKIEYSERRSAMRRDPEGDDAADTLESPEEEPKDGLREEEDRTAEIVDQLKRLQAEFENYRKRIQKERLESWNMAKRDLLAALLPYIDDMRRVMDWDGDEADLRSLFEGTKLVAKKMMSVLEEEGFETIEALGKPFDPNFHEALLIQETDDPAKENIVEEVLVEGYRFKGTLLRPARVKVLKFGGDEGGGEGEETDGAGEEGTRPIDPE